MRAVTQGGRFEALPKDAKFSYAFSSVQVSGLASNYLNGQVFPNGSISVSVHPPIGNAAWTWGTITIDAAQPDAPRFSGDDNSNGSIKLLAWNRAKNVYQFTVKTTISGQSRTDVITVIGERLVTVQYIDNSF